MKFRRAASRGLAVYQKTFTWLHNYTPSATQKQKRVFKFLHVIGDIMIHELHRRRFLHNWCKFDIMWGW